MTPRLAPADEDAIAAAAAGRAERQRQADVDARAAARLAELRAAKLGAACLRGVERLAPVQVAAGIMVKWERARLWVDPDGNDSRMGLACRQVLADWKRGVLCGEVARRRSRGDWCARLWRGGFCGSSGPWTPAASVEEAIVWVEQQIE